MRYLGLSAVLALFAVAGTGCDSVNERNPDGTYTSSRSTTWGTDRGTYSTSRSVPPRPRRTEPTGRSVPTTR